MDWFDEQLETLSFMQWNREEPPSAYFKKLNMDKKSMTCIIIL